MGIVSPVGVGLSAAWANILAARSGIATITRFDASAFPSRIAGDHWSLPKIPSKPSPT
jgi:3-oxoacyl-[acyl-carrier-protein] synthase II